MTAFVWRNVRDHSSTTTFSVLASNSSVLQATAHRPEIVSVRERRIVAVAARAQAERKRNTHDVSASKVIGGYQRIAEHPEQCDTHHVHASKVIESIKGSRSIRSNATFMMSMPLGYRAFQRALHRAVRGPPANRRGSRHRYASAFRCSDTIPGMRVHRC
jgi:hypothetical protein